MDHHLIIVEFIYQDAQREAQKRAEDIRRARDVRKQNQRRRRK